MSPNCFHMTCWVFSKSPFLSHNQPRNIIGVKVWLQVNHSYNLSRSWGQSVTILGINGLITGPKKASLLRDVTGWQTSAQSLFPYYLTHMYSSGNQPVQHYCNPITHVIQHSLQKQCYEEAVPSDRPPLGQLNAKSGYMIAQLIIGYTVQHLLLLWVSLLVIPHI